MTKSRSFKRAAAAASFAIAIAAATGLAHAEIAVGDKLGTTEENIRAALEKMGYKIDEIENEDGEIEVSASMDGEEFEIAVEPDTGEVTEIEQDD